MTGHLLSWSLTSDLRALFAFHFMVNAYRAGTVIAVLAAVIGWFLVLRRQAFAGHALAVVGFPGAAGAGLLGLPVGLGYFGFATVAALGLAAVPRSQRGAARSQEAAAIGVVQSFALALGAVFVALDHAFLGGVTALLFGSFLGITDAQVLSLLAIAVVALACLAALGRPLLFSSVDADVAAARQVPVRMLSTLFLVLVGATAAAVSQLTGSLLVFALLVMPAAAAFRLTAKPGRSLLLAVLLGLAVTWTGLAVAYFSPYPVGFCVTTVGFVVYLCSGLGGQARVGRRGA